MSLHIKRALDNVSTFTELKSIIAGQPNLEENENLENLVDKVRVGISFFGWQYISVLGYQEKLSIDELAKRVMDLVKKNFEFSEDERMAGKEVAGLINQIYARSDTLLNRKHFFAWLFCKLRDFLAIGGLHYADHPRWQWRINQEYKVFDFYTKDQYLKSFNRLPNGSCHWMANGSPDRWISPNLENKYFPRAST